MNKINSSDVISERQFDREYGGCPAVALQVREMGGRAGERWEGEQEGEWEGEWEGEREEWEGEGESDF